MTAGRRRDAAASAESLDHRQQTEFRLRVALEGPRGSAYRSDVLVIGGGLFGCTLALHWAKAGRRVALLEKAPGLLSGASSNNQARVHVGYHYPRSHLTALRSRINRERFEHDFGPCIDRSRQSVYAIARHYSNVTAQQFHASCQRAGAPLWPAPRGIQELFDPHRIEAVFCVRESFFDAHSLNRLLRARLRDAGVSCHFQTRAELLLPEASGGVSAICRNGADERVRFTAEQVYNCTYADLNELLAASGLPTIALKHELTELVLVRPPEHLRRLAVTVMCGPFFSLTPFPALGLHALSHVRYTPHATWTDDEGPPLPGGRDRIRAAPPPTAAKAMLNDAARYLPSARGCQPVQSLWEVKTVLPRNETDDGRPIFVRRDHGLPGLTCVLGAKLDNVYDVLSALSPERERRSA